MALAVRVSMSDTSKFNDFIETMLNNKEFVQYSSMKEIEEIGFENRSKDAKNR